MKYFKNDTASYYSSEEVQDSIERLCSLVRTYPFILEPLRGSNEKVENIFSSQGFLLHPTVRKTTLLYEQRTDGFLKILHPLTLKNKLFFLLIDRAKSIYRLSEHLRSQGIKVPHIMAYGMFKGGRKPFFMARRMEGKSLYDSLIREKNILPLELYIKVIDEVAKLHKLGYWLGDAHLSHIYIHNSEVSGFIDIDGIKKNAPFKVRRFAKDLAGLNHPELPLSEDEKTVLLKYYMALVRIKGEGAFVRLISHYTRQRWKERVS